MIENEDTHDKDSRKRIEKKESFLALNKGKMASDMNEESPSDVMTRYEIGKIGQRLPIIREPFRKELALNLARRRVLPQAVEELRDLADWLEEWGASENPFSK